MRVYFYATLISALLLPSVPDASAAAAVAATAARSVRTGVIAPVPGAALGVTMGRVLAAPGALGLPSQATVLPALASPRVGNAAVLPAVAVVAPQAAVQSKKSGLPAPPAAGNGKILKTVHGQLSHAQQGLAPAQKNGAALSARTKLGQLFDGLRGRKAAGVSRTEDFRPPDWSEDRRINRALKRLAESPLGLDVYRYVSENYNVTIKVDDDRNAGYDARVEGSGDRRTLTLTEKLVDNESPEVVAAYVAREMSELYFDSFPESVERNYMAHGNMVRVFAELTDSGKSRNGYWWDRGRDQRSGDAYAMERYYASWKAAVEEYARSNTSIEESSFFTYLKGDDTSNKGRDSRRGLYERYQSGDISYRKYKEMRKYFYSVVDSESEWVGETGRW